MSAGDIIALVAVGVMLGSLYVAWLVYQRKNQGGHDEQISMHAENRQKLNQLIQFRDVQEQLNRQRDEQVKALTSLAATTAESLKVMTSGLDRRLELIEDELRDNRHHNG